MKRFDKSVLVAGRNLVLRAATPADAAFAHALRSNERKTAFLNPIQGTVADQAAWLASCHADPHQIYFVIEGRDAGPLGLVRIYDQRGDSFCWGSWIIRDGAPASAAIESALLLYRYALDAAGFARSHFDVRIGNDKVIDFHRKLGAVETGRDALDVHFAIDAAAIRAALAKYRKYLPDD